MSQVLQKFVGDEISEKMIAEVVELFSTHYGVWGPLASEKIGPFAKQGCRVKMSPKKLIDQILPSDSTNIHIRALINGQLAGHVFGTRWFHDGRTILWITQLCVDSQHRNQGIAKKLLEELRDPDDQAVGILSSHPFAILAALRVFGRGVEDVNLEMTRTHAAAVMQSCPVRYVRNAKLRGSLFGSREEDVVSCADTAFWVDHVEPLWALDVVKEKGVVWPFGRLPDGCEFLILVEARAALGNRR